MELQKTADDFLTGMPGVFAWFDENPPARASGRERQLIAVVDVVVSVFRIDWRANEECNA